jgi:taurine dioxygenase
MSSSINCTPLSPVFGARLQGLDTSKPASAEEAATVRVALNDYKLVVVAGGQRLSSSQLAAFGKSLGLGPPETFGAQDLVSSKNSYMSSVPEEPSVLQLEYGPHLPPADINVWHQDHSWRPQVTQYELSYADVVPACGGGDVLYADASQAYRTLSPRLQTLVQGANCLSLLAQGYQNLEVGSAAYAQAMLAHPPVPQPVVALHAGTGDRWLNVNAGYSLRIPQLSPTESAAILSLLCAHITQPEHCLRVSYQVGDVVIFDNHRLQHYAVSDYYPAPRRIRRMSFGAQVLICATTPGTTSSSSSTHDDESKEATTMNTVVVKETPGAIAHTASSVAFLCPAAQEVAHLATQLAAALRLLARGGQADLCAGFVSARLLLRTLSSHPMLFLAPSHGTHWTEAVPNTFGVFRTSTPTTTTTGKDNGCSRVSKRLAGQGPLPNFPSTAVSAAIYAALPEVHAIVHAHATTLMSLAALGGDAGTILPISEPSFLFYKRVAYLPCNFYFDDDYLVQIVEALQLTDGNENDKEHPPFCIMMSNHSYIMTGRTLQECYLRCYMLEQSASIQLGVLSANGGTLPRIPSPQECLDHRRSYEGYNGCAPYDGQLEWPGLVRGLEKESPGWSDDAGLKLGQAFEEAVVADSQVPIEHANT